MTEKDRVKQAKRYMDKLAQGQHPFTGKELPEDTVLNDLDLARSFAYISGILQKILDGETVLRQSAKNKMEFSMSPKCLASITPKPCEITMNEFTRMLYDAVNNPLMRRPDPKRFTQWLVDEGILYQRKEESGRILLLPAEMGRRIGITVRDGRGKYGEFLTLYYGPSAQKFLLLNYWLIMGKK